MYCLICGRAQLQGEWSCPCGGCIYGPALSRQEGRQLPSSLTGLLGQVAALPRGKTLLLYGPRGCGKSTIALQGLPKPVVVSTEMGADMVAAYAKRLKVKLSRVGAPEHDEELGWRWAHGFEDAGGIIVDSVTVRDPLELFHAARDWGMASGLPVICVSQVTVDGQVRGGSQLAHEADVVVSLLPVDGVRELTVEKSRFGPQTSLRFRLDGEGPALAGGYFYTVAGDFPGYRLAPYPWSDSEVWAAVEKGELDAPAGPPLAVAARRSTLYGGWVEPPDVNARAAFAERHGVPFWRLT